MPNRHGGKSIRIARSVWLNATQYWCIQKLLDSGLWGNSATDVINLLIDSQLRKIVYETPQVFAVVDSAADRVVDRVADRATPDVGASTRIRPGSDSDHVYRAELFL